MHRHWCHNPIFRALPQPVCEVVKCRIQMSLHLSVLGSPPTLPNPTSPTDNVQFPVELCLLCLIIAVFLQQLWLFLGPPNEGGSLLILACPHRCFTEHRMEHMGRPKQVTSLVHLLIRILMKLFLICGGKVQPLSLHSYNTCFVAKRLQGKARKSFWLGGCWGTTSWAHQPPAWGKRSLWMLSKLSH